MTTVAKQPDTLASLVSEDAKRCFARLADLGRKGDWRNDVWELSKYDYKMIPFDKIGIQKSFVFLHATHVVKVGGSSSYEAQQFEEWPQDTKGMIARTEQLELDGEAINVTVQERCTPIGDVRKIIAKVITDSHEGNWGVRLNSDGSYSLVIFDFVM